MNDLSPSIRIAELLFVAAIATRPPLVDAADPHPILIPAMAVS